MGDPVHLGLNELVTVIGDDDGAALGGQLRGDAADVPGAVVAEADEVALSSCLLYTSPSPRDS